MEQVTYVTSPWRYHVKHRCVTMVYYIGPHIPNHLSQQCILISFSTCSPLITHHHYTVNFKLYKSWSSKPYTDLIQFLFIIICYINRKNVQPLDCNWLLNFPMCLFLGWSNSSILTDLYSQRVPRTSSDESNEMKFNALRNSLEIQLQLKYHILCKQFPM